MNENVTDRWPQYKVTGITVVKNEVHLLHAGAHSLSEFEGMTKMW